MSCPKPINLPNPRYYYKNINSPLWPKKSWDYELYQSDLKSDPYVSLMLDVPCGKCIYCRKSYASQWRARLLIDYRTYPKKNAIFVTFTIAPEHYGMCDEPYYYMRHFLDRYRKKYKQSLRYFFITEKGEQNGRLHFHGILYDVCGSFYELKKLWKYGIIWIGWCNDATCNYILKYLTKSYNSEFKPRIYTSPGVGKYYLTEEKLQYHYDNENNTITINGYNYPMPRYLYNRVFPDPVHRHYISYVNRELYPHGKNKDGTARTEEEKLAFQHKQRDMDNYIRPKIKTIQSKRPKPMTIKQMNALFIKK